LRFLDVDPWPESVTGAALLDELRATFRRYVVASDDALSACALFALHTYAFDLGDASPILFVTAPSKRCGKSRVLQVQARLVKRPLATSSASPAGIYHAIEQHQPTLLIDEVDSFLKGDDQLRGLINAGHTRDAAFHLGCIKVGDNQVSGTWSTWAPKVFSGIGKLADTIEDRAIIIQMRRRRKDETVERLRYTMRFDDLKRKCARFVADHAGAIRAADPQIPDGLNDRAADSWIPLLILADLAGGHWPETTRRAALELSGDADADSGDTRTQLLADIRAVFAQPCATRMASTDVCDRLAEIEGRPWAEYGRTGKPITPNGLAYLLRDFGIMPRTLRIGEDRAKGYDIADFADAFSRYLPKTGLPISDVVTTRASIGENGVLGNVTQPACHGSENTTPATKDGLCHGVTDRNVQSGEEEAEELLL
jgi:putative DNA primase/helicase